MTPNQTYSVQMESVAEKNQTSRTYRLNIDEQRIVGFIDGQESIRQAILLILNTERFRYGIYSWDYGSEIGRVIGGDFQIAQSKVKRYIREALLQDERITDVDGFVFEKTERNTLNVEFTAHTVFGEIGESTEVII